LAVRRGDLVTVALPGAYGKPRPALVIQSDLFDEHPSVTILPVTGEVRDTPLFRIDIAPSAANGLRKPSQVMVDKAQTVPRGKLGDTIGRLEDDAMLSVTRALAVFLGIA
jgi:mRNA interferase MazF